MFEDLYERRAETMRMIEDGEIKATAGNEILRSIAAALGDEVVSRDSLVDQWEREFEEGKIPDLEAM